MCDTRTRTHADTLRLYAEVVDLWTHPGRPSIWQIARFFCLPPATVDRWCRNWDNLRGGGEG